MNDCAASVSVDTISPEGVVSFKVSIADCDDSKGSFDFELDIIRNNGTKQTLLKTETWARTFGQDSAEVSYDPNLQDEEEVDEVRVVDDFVNALEGISSSGREPLLV